jgi:hypothetical protein
MQVSFPLVYRWQNLQILHNHPVLIFFSANDLIDKSFLRMIDKKFLPGMYDTTQANGRSRVSMFGLCCMVQVSPLEDWSRERRLRP